MWQGRWQGRSPAGDVHQRARKIISPSGGIVRGKFPSRKNGRMVHYEGLLELDAIYLFETSPFVARYREQPRTIRYPDGARLRRYTTDFEVVLTTGECILVEVKPARFLELEDLTHKFKCIDDYMRRSEWPFFILTDDLIRQEPRLSNLRQIYHQAARIPPTPVAQLIALRKTRDQFPLSIRSAVVTLKPYGVDPFTLLLSGLLQCSLDQAISTDTLLTLTTEANHGWFWIAKKYGF
jgi:hypothetical protein